MLKNFKNFLHEANLLQPGQPALLAVSGGVDSVVMSHLFHRSGQPFGIAHAHFGLREKEADEDAKWVAQWAKKLGVPFYTRRFNVSKQRSATGQSTQMAARELRYVWLEDVRRKEGYHAIATAHHCNDVVETVLLNLVRGTGIAGLHGICARQVLKFSDKSARVIRPLLFATKADITTYTRKHKLNYREDTSNAEVEYARNKLRHEVVPVLKALNPDLEATFSKMTAHLHDTEAIYRHALERFKKRVLRRKGEEWWIDYARLQTYPGASAILYEVLRDFGFNRAQVETMEQQLENQQPGKQYFSKTHRLIKDRRHLILAPREVEAPMHASIETGDRKVSVRDFKLRLQEVSSPHFKIPKRPEVACLDYEKLQFPLLLRPWQEGDYFYPLGLTGAKGQPKKKKVKRYLTDLKLPLTEKERTWVLISGKYIVWVVGHRLDARFAAERAGSKIKILKVKRI